MAFTSDVENMLKTDREHVIDMLKPTPSQDLYAKYFGEKNTLDMNYIVQAKTNGAEIYNKVRKRISIASSYGSPALTFCKLRHDTLSSFNT